MKTKFLLVVVLLVVQTFAQQKVLTLEQSLEIGLENNKELKISESKVELNKAKYYETGTTLLPTIRASASYARLSDVPPFEVTVPFSPNPIKIQDPILNNYNLGLSITQPIFTGFKLSSIKSAAKNNYEAESIQFDAEKNKLSLSIKEAFWNLYKAQKYVQLINENKRKLEEHFKDTEQFFFNELVTKNDLLKIKSQLSSIDYQLVEGNKNLSLARALFNKIIGLPITEQTQIDADNSLIKTDLLDLSEYINQALAQRNEIAAVEKIVNASDDLITAANSDWFPSVFLFGNYYYNKPNQRILPAQDKFNDTWDVGVSLSWELWNWGKTSYKVEQAEQQFKQSKLALDILKENIQLEVYKNYLTVKSEMEKLISSNQYVESSEENYRITKEKYNAQVATSTELLDSEVELLDAKVKQSNAISDYKIALEKLRISIGEQIY